MHPKTTAISETKTCFLLPYFDVTSLILVSVIWTNWIKKNIYPDIPIPLFFGHGTEIHIF